MANVLFRRGTQEYINNNVPISDGQVVFNETDQAIYVDTPVNNVITRLRYGGGNLSRSDIDSALSDTSENPVQNKVITESVLQKTDIVNDYNTAVAVTATDIPVGCGVIKTANTKIGDLQSALNTTNGTVAQHTTDIEALNTGLATKIGTYETQQDNRILNIVHNINSDEIIAYDEKLATWFPIWSKPKLAGQAFFIPASNVEITYQAIFMYGKMRIVQLNLRLLTQFADGAEVATSTATAPINASYCTCRDGQNHLATFAFNPDRRLVCWGANPANTGNIYPIQLTYFV